AVDSGFRDQPAPADQRRRVDTGRAYLAAQRALDARAALREGLKAAQGEIVVTIDSDSVVEPTTVLPIVGFTVSTLRGSVRPVRPHRPALALELEPDRARAGDDRAPRLRDLYRALLLAYRAELPVLVRRRLRRFQLSVPAVDPPLRHAHRAGRALGHALSSARPLPLLPPPGGRPPRARGSAPPPSRRTGVGTRARRCDGARARSRPRLP